MANSKTLGKHCKTKTSVSAVSCRRWTTLYLLVCIITVANQATSSPVIVTDTSGASSENVNVRDLQSSDSFNLGYGFGGPGLFGGGFGSHGGCGGSRPFHYPSSYIFGNGYGQGGYYG